MKAATAGNPNCNHVLNSTTPYPPSRGSCPKQEDTNEWRDNNGRIKCSEYKICGEKEGKNSGVIRGECRADDVADDYGRERGEGVKVANALR